VSAVHHPDAADVIIADLAEGQDPDENDEWWCTPRTLATDMLSALTAAGLVVVSVADHDRLAADHDTLVDLVRELWCDVLPSAQRQWGEWAEADDTLATLLLRLVTDETP